LREFVAGRGGARFLVAPNSFHYLGLAAWKRAFPNAEVWLAPGLPVRVTDVPGGCELREDAATPFAATLLHRVLDCGRGVTEVAFFHASSRTLLLCDSSFNLSPPPRAFDRLGARLMGIPFRFGPTRTARLMLLRDRAAVAAWVDELCAWDLVRVVMAHGEPLDAGPRELRTGADELSSAAALRSRKSASEATSANRRRVKQTVACAPPMRLHARPLHDARAALPVTMALAYIDRVAISMSSSRIQRDSR
jgi:hypothetical protein